jgi:exosome complex protein LRP1
VKIPAEVERPKPEPGPSIHVPIKVTSKMIERARYEKEIAMDDSEDEVLEVFNDVPRDEDEEMAEVLSKEQRTKGKQKADEDVSENELEVSLRGKRRRPVVDPFSGTSSLHCSYTHVDLLLGYDNDVSMAPTQDAPSTSQSNSTEIFDAPSGKEPLPTSTTPINTRQKSNPSKRSKHK